MNTLLLFLCYAFVCSIVFVYCIGCERLLLFSRLPLSVGFYVKYYIISVLSALLCFCIHIMFGYSILMFIPFFCVSITLFFDFLISRFFRINSVAPNEKNFLFGLTLFAVFEAHSFYVIFLIISIGFCSLALFDILLKSACYLINMRNTNYYLKLVSLTLIVIGCMLLGFSAFNIFITQF
ncbi:MAG: hypothetical protein IJU92_04050 [Spirochaetaceae bacterium]|nr:hypothetical protein [Spirochaetaceae bacterium]